MRHMMMGGFGGHALAGGLGLWMLHRMLRRLMMFVLIGGLLAVVVVLWLKLKAAQRNQF